MDNFLTSPAAQQEPKGVLPLTKVVLWLARMVLYFVLRLRLIQTILLESISRWQEDVSFVF